MPTNPMGKYRKTVGINMKNDMAVELKRRGQSMGISTSKYCKVVLSEWLASGKRLTLQEGK